MKFGTFLTGFLVGSVPFFVSSDVVSGLSHLLSTCLVSLYDAVCRFAAF